MQKDAVEVNHDNTFGRGGENNNEHPFRFNRHRGQQQGLIKSKRMTIFALALRNILTTHGFLRTYVGHMLTLEINHVDTDDQVNRNHDNR